MKIIGIGREVIGLHKDGSTIRLELSIAEWRDSEDQQCFTGIMRDVTLRNEQARELQKAIEGAQQAETTSDDEEAQRLLAQCRHTRDAVLDIIATTIRPRFGSSAYRKSA